ncbi:zinc ribbon domain-containing protein [Paenibacillus lutimineralis]|nr:zinc ribbon domain-containing protein [Paenibacillus lutimineralis]
MDRMKICVACGMPMTEVADFALGDVEKDYCVHCMRPDGTMQSYEEKLDSLSALIVRTQGLDQGVARNAARNMMARLPAWKVDEADEGTD